MSTPGNDLEAQDVDLARPALGASTAQTAPGRCRQGRAYSPQSCRSTRTLPRSRAGAALRAADVAQNGLAGRVCVVAPSSGVAGCGALLSLPRPVGDRRSPLSAAADRDCPPSEPSVTVMSLTVARDDDRGRRPTGARLAHGADHGAVDNSDDARPDPPGGSTSSTGSSVPLASSERGAPRTVDASRHRRRRSRPATSTDTIVPRTPARRGPACSACYAERRRLVPGRPRRRRRHRRPPQRRGRSADKGGRVQAHRHLPADAVPALHHADLLRRRPDHGSSAPPTAPATRRPKTRRPAGDQVLTAPTALPGRQRRPTGSTTASGGSSAAAATTADFWNRSAYVRCRQDPPARSA